MQERATFEPKKPEAPTRNGAMSDTRPELEMAGAVTTTRQTLETAALIKVHKNLRDDEIRQLRKRKMEDREEMERLKMQMEEERQRNGEALMEDAREINFFANRTAALATERDNLLREKARLLEDKRRKTRDVEWDNDRNKSDLKGMLFHLKALTGGVQDMRKRLGVNVEEDTDTEDDAEEKEETEDKDDEGTTGAARGTSTSASST